MAFRATNVIPQDGYERARKTAVSIKNWATGMVSTMASGASAVVVEQALAALVNYRVDLLSVASIAGIADYAQSQEDDPAYDVAAEFAGLISELNSAIALIITAFPADGDGYWLAYTVNAQGVRTYRQFTGPQLSALRTQLGAIAAAVS